MNLNLAHNSVGFYQISKLACIPITLLMSSPQPRRDTTHDLCVCTRVRDAPFHRERPDARDARAGYLFDGSTVPMRVKLTLLPSRASAQESRWTDTFRF